MTTTRQCQQTVNTVQHQQQCHYIVESAGSNFTASFRYLDAEQQRAMTALYAFCRVIDDIVDEVGDAEAKRGALEDWRNVIRGAGLPRLAEGSTRNDTGKGCRRNDTESVSHELAWAREHFDVPTQYLHEMIDGVAQDIDPQPMATLKDLLHYCYGVAGTVGLSCLRIFRVEETEQTRRAALALANAFQLTNILRDVKEDAQRGRIYLPEEDLQRFGIATGGLRQDPRSFFAMSHSTSCNGLTERFDDLIAFEASRASGYYLEAWREFPASAWAELKPARMMSAYYRRILEKIRCNPSRPRIGRVRLTVGEKLWMFGKMQGEEIASSLRSSQ